MEINRYAVTFGKGIVISPPQILKNVLEHILTVFLKPAGLRLLARHASQFSSCLLDHYRTLFEVMSKLCGHINPEMKNTSHYALEAFLKQVNTHQTHRPNFNKTKEEKLHCCTTFSSHTGCTVGGRKY